MTTTERRHHTVVGASFTAIIVTFILLCWNLGISDGAREERDWNEFCSTHFGAVADRDPAMLWVCVSGDGSVVYQQEHR